MKRLFRSRNGFLGGVCTGLGDYFDVDPTLIKLLFVLLIFTAIPIIWIYIFLWILIPKGNITN